MKIPRALLALLLASTVHAVELDAPISPVSPAPTPIAAPEMLQSAALTPLSPLAPPQVALPSIEAAVPTIPASAQPTATASAQALQAPLAAAQAAHEPAAAQPALNAAFDGQHAFESASAGFVAARGEQGPVVDRSSPGPDFSKGTSLHAHSYFSDGTMTPEAVVERAHAEGVVHLALSDHDSVAGIKRAYAKAKELGMDFHPSAELTARGGVHVGAVDIDITNPKLLAHLEKVRAARRKHAEGMADYLNSEQVETDLEKLSSDARAVKSLAALREFRSRGGRIELEQIIAESQYEQGGTIEMPHVARALLRAGLIDNVDDSFDTFFKTLPPLKDVPPDPTPEEVVAVVHAAGGKAFLNHPYTVRAKDDAAKDRLAYEILKKGFDGVEAYRPSNATSPDGKRRAEERTAKYVKWADELGLIVGNGADFHGDDTHLNHIVVWMPKALETKLLAALAPAQRKALAVLESSEPPSFTGPIRPLVSVAQPATPHFPLIWLALVIAAVAALHFALEFLS